METRTQFRPGTTPGEASWLTVKAMEAIVPLAVHLFGRTDPITGGLRIDFDKLLEASAEMAVRIQDDSFKRTSESAEVIP